MQTLDKHFRALTKTAFQNFGFAQGDVLAHWPQIVGADLAAVSTPERIRWPPGQTEKQGGTLHLKVAAGRNLDVDYAAPAIVEKVNRFLGYAAVAKIKTVASYEAPKPKRKVWPDLPVDAAVAARVQTVKDTDLQLALARLGTSVLSEHPTSPQAEQAIGQFTPNSSRTPT